MLSLFMKIYIRKKHTERYEKKTNKIKKTKRETNLKNISSLF